MTRRIGFDDDEASGAVRRRGQRWRESRVVVEHRHAPMTPEERTRRSATRRTPRGSQVASASGREAGGFGRLLKNPVVLILGFILFNVFFVAFLIARAVWLAGQRGRPTMDA